MSAILLVYLAKPRFGGWVVFTAHLARALAAAGSTVHLAQLAGRTERKLRWFGYGLAYQNVGLVDLLALCETHPTIVTAADQSNLDVLGELLTRRALLVVHDPTEMSAALCEVARDGRVVTVRAANVANLAARGVCADLVRHPYIPATPTRHVTSHACCFARLDWDKHQELIVAANQRLPRERACLLWGAENSLYTHLRLDALDPGWRRWYKGRFGRSWGEAAQMAASANFVVDASTISGDGGGSQYTFLEAWDGGAHLVVNAGWTSVKGEVKPGKNCTAVADVDELVAVLSGEPSPTVQAAGTAALAPHEPIGIAKAYQKLLGLT